jgi:hypothetical protein
MDLKLHRMIDLIEKVQCIKTRTLHAYFMSYCPLLIFILYFLSIKAIDMKLHRMIDLIKKKCCTQELVLCISYFLIYCPMLMFILQFCPGQLYGIKAMDLKLHKMIDLIKKKCSA